jgi:5-methylcytosine-specific restriction endonuclease McrA
MALVAVVLASKGRTCHLCGLPGATTADHVIPRSKGGAHSLDNLEPAHHACNSARGDRTLEDWFRAKPHFAAIVRGDRRPLPPSREW